MSMLAVWLALFAAGLLVCPNHLSSADHTPAEIARAREIVRQNLASKVPGYSVSVAVDGVCVWEENGGFSDVEARVPVSGDTLFRIGSISKSITSVALMRLVEQGRLDLSAPIQTYLPEFPEKGVPISILDLSGHLSGVRNYRGDEALSPVQHVGYASRLSVFQDDPLVTPPRTEFVYSGYNWVLIEAAIARVTGQSFPGFMADAVLSPLGLNHTRAEMRGDLPANIATFYEVGPDGSFVSGPSIDPAFAWAVGGYLSTAHDLAIFGSSLLRPGVLTGESLRMLFESQTTSDGAPTGYGIGWHVYEKPRVLYHTGWTVGGLSVLLILPDERIVVGLVTNRGALNIKAGDPLSLSLDSIAFEISKVFQRRNQ